MSTRFNLLTHKSRLNRPKYHLKLKFLFAHVTSRIFFFKVHLLLFLYQFKLKSLPRTTKMSTDAVSLSYIRKNQFTEIEMKLHFGNCLNITH